MGRSVLTLAVVTFVLASTASAAPPPPDWSFRTPGGTAYCATDRGGFLCVRPTDGFWIRLTDLFGSNVDVRVGVAERFRGLRIRDIGTLAFGRTYSTSDAAIVTCRSGRNGVTCVHAGGLSFTLGRARGHRIFYEAPGFPPRVRPLFRALADVRCGLDRDNLEPASPVLVCWRAVDGLVLRVAHQSSTRGGHGRQERAIGHRPAGFPRLGPGSSFAWRCRLVTEALAEGCSANAGVAVFTCSTTTRLTCRNRAGHGFWVSARSFYTF